MIAEELLEMVYIGEPLNIVLDDAGISVKKVEIHRNPLHNLRI